MPVFPISFFLSFLCLPNFESHLHLDPQLGPNFLGPITIYPFSNCLPGSTFIFFRAILLLSSDNRVTDALVAPAICPQIRIRSFEFQNLTMSKLGIY